MNEKELLEITFIEKILEAGSIKTTSKKYSPIIERFRLASWILPGHKTGVYQLIQSRKDEIVAHRDKLWPSRECDLPLLMQYKLSPQKVADLMHLPTLRRGFKPKHGFINNKTWRALHGNGPKGKQWLEPGSETTITNDMTTRFVPNKGLVFEQTGRDPIDLWSLAEQLTECSIPERAYLNGGKFRGTLPDAIITIENLGAYIDIVKPENFIFVYSPGNDISQAGLIISHLPNVPWVHFGDLDSMGVDIFKNMQNGYHVEGRFYIPEFADEYVDLSQKRSVVWTSEFNHKVVNKLRDLNLGLFQEVFILDDRLVQDLTKFIEQA